MNSVYQTNDLCASLRGNRYPGRGIVVGETADGRAAAVAYFIMGRSANSRNRTFSMRGDTLFTVPFDEAAVEDPSLIIYAAKRHVGTSLVVTNGDQTDTVADALRAGGTMEEALRTRKHEPDAPNFTPRISAVLDFDRAAAAFTYKMSIVKSADEDGENTARYTFEYPALPGVGHFLHTYAHDGSPIPTFVGEPERIAVAGDLDTFASSLWDALDPDNKISLYVGFFDLASGERQERIFNKNEQKEGL